MLPSSQPKDVLYSRDAIHTKVQQLAKNLQSQDLDTENVVFVGVLNGAFIFFADLVREFPQPLTLDFIKVASYQGMVSGTLSLVQDVKVDVRGRDVVIVEDIIDSGKTIAFLKKHFEQKGVKSLRFVALFMRSDADEDVKKQIHLYGFTLNDEFVIGYGLDVDQRFRNLADVYAVRQ